MISLNIKAKSFGTNLPLFSLFGKCDVSIATLEYLLKIAAQKRLPRKR